MSLLKIQTPPPRPFQVNDGETVFSGQASAKVVALRLRVGQRILPIPLLSNGDFHWRLSTGRGFKWVWLEAESGSGWQRVGRWLFYARRAGSPHSLREYHRWIKQREEPLTPAQTGRLDSVREPLLISVVTPLYNTPPALWQAAAESVLGQSYPHWEWCLADDCSQRRETARLAEDLAARDKRVRFLQRPDNGHISRASNAAAGLARGTFLTFLDHDDQLAPEALSRFSIHWQDHPNHRWVYSDEDKLDSDGQRKGPYFKPDWNPDLLRAQNYACHLSGVDRQLFLQLGGFRAGLEGSQDHDLFLRLSEKLDPAEIGHIPRILYHWRETEGSTASGPEAKSYTFAAAQRALREHLERTGTPFDSIERSADLYWNVCYKNTLGAPAVIAVPPPVAGWADWARAVNRAVAETEARWFILAWEKVALDPRDYGRLGGALSRPEIGVAGGLVVTGEGNPTIHYAGAVLHPRGIHYPFRGFAPQHGGMGIRARVQQNYTLPCGGFLACRREAFLQAGGLDLRNWHPAWIVAALCLRLRSTGHWNLYDPSVIARIETVHRLREGGPPPELLEQFPSWFDGDPAFNPNLTLTAPEMVWG